MYVDVLNMKAMAIAPRILPQRPLLVATHTQVHPSPVLSARAMWDALPRVDWCEEATLDH